MAPMRGWRRGFFGRGCLLASMAEFPEIQRLLFCMRAASATRQYRSKPRCSSQSVTRRSYSNCSHSAVRT